MGGGGGNKKHLVYNFVSFESETAQDQFHYCLFPHFEWLKRTESFGWLVVGVFLILTGFNNLKECLLSEEQIRDQNIDLNSFCTK